MGSLLGEFIRMHVLASWRFGVLASWPLLHLCIFASLHLCVFALTRISRHRCGRAGCVGARASALAMGQLPPRAGQVRASNHQLFVRHQSEIVDAPSRLPVSGLFDALRRIPKSTRDCCISCELRKREIEREERNVFFSRNQMIDDTILFSFFPKATVFSLSPLNESDLTKRAESLLAEVRAVFFSSVFLFYFFAESMFLVALCQAAKESLNKFVNANDIVTGNARLNFAFVATLFVRCDAFRVSVVRAQAQNDAVKQNHFQSTTSAALDSEDEQEDEEEVIFG